MTLVLLDCAYTKCSVFDIVSHESHEPRIIIDCNAELVFDSMAIIAGARRWHQIRASLHTGFGPLMKLSLISSPIALAFAQQFLPEQTWVPFFNIVAFVIGTYINTFAKRKRIAALRRKAAAEERDPRFGGGSSRLSGDGEGRY